MILQGRIRTGEGEARDVVREGEKDVPAGVATPLEKAWIALWTGRLQADQVRTPLIRLRRPFPGFDAVQTLRGVVKRA